MVLVTRGKGGQPLVSRLWGNGFLPSKYQGVRFRSGPDPVLYLANPPGIDAAGRRALLDGLRDLHRLRIEEKGERSIESRIEQYEMAYRMQMSVPGAMDLSQEPARARERYGKDVEKPGSYAANCLLARRLAEQGVRFVQIYHPGWDQHGGLKAGITQQCQETDQATAACCRTWRSGECWRTRW